MSSRREKSFNLSLICGKVWSFSSLTVSVRTCGGGGSADGTVKLVLSAHFPWVLEFSLGSQICTSASRALPFKYPSACAHLCFRKPVRQRSAEEAGCPLLHSHFPLKQVVSQTPGPMLWTPTVPVILLTCIHSSWGYDIQWLPACSMDPGMCTPLLGATPLSHPVRPKYDFFFFSSPWIHSPLLC